MYHLKTEVQENANYRYSISLEKLDICWKFFIQEKKHFISLTNIMKNYCVLSNFSIDYDILHFHGKGHFAQVFSVQKKDTKQKFATKIFNKSDIIFEKNKVISVFFFVTLYALAFH